MDLKPLERAIRRLTYAVIVLIFVLGMLAFFKDRDLDGRVEKLEKQVDVTTKGLKKLGGIE